MSDPQFLALLFTHILPIAIPAAIVIAQIVKYIGGKDDGLPWGHHTLTTGEPPLVTLPPIEYDPVPLAPLTISREQIRRLDPFDALLQFVDECYPWGEDIFLPLSLSSWHISYIRERMEERGYSAFEIYWSFRRLGIDISRSEKVVYEPLCVYDDVALTRYEDIDSSKRDLI